MKWYSSITLAIAAIASVSVLGLYLVDRQRPRVGDGIVKGDDCAARIYLDPTLLKNGETKQRTACEMTHTKSASVFRVYQDADGDGLRIIRYRRQHDGSLEFAEDFHIVKNRVVEDKQK